MLKKTMEKVLIVGSGITGSLTASLLRDVLPDTAVIQLVDKSRGSGGRMGTSRSGVDNHSSVDLGAQYISCTKEQMSSHKQFYDELLREELLKPLDGVIEGENRYSDNMEHFVPPHGIGSLPKFYLKKSGASVTYGHVVNSVSKNGNKWQVSSNDGFRGLYDCVVLTLPVPQLLQLGGDLPGIISGLPDVKRRLGAVSYSSRFALGLFYSPDKSVDVPWTMKYVNDDPVIKYVCVDDKKRNAEVDGLGSSIVVHTTVPFGLKHLEEDKDTVCTEHVLPRVKQLLPHLPEPNSVKNHKWRYSQVYRGYEDSPGSIQLSSCPLLLVGGDAFTMSTFDGCLSSALSLTDRVVTSLKTPGL